MFALCLATNSTLREELKAIQARGTDYSYPILTPEALRRIAKPFKMEDHRLGIGIYTFTEPDTVPVRLYLLCFVERTLVPIISLLEPKVLWRSDFSFVLGKIAGTHTLRCQRSLRRISRPPFFRKVFVQHCCEYMRATLTWRASDIAISRISQLHFESKVSQFDTVGPAFWTLIRSYYQVVVEGIEGTTHEAVLERYIPYAAETTILLLAQLSDPRFGQFLTYWFDMQRNG